ncbi:MAG: O-methyltransferase [Sciscionella sp.]
MNEQVFTAVDDYITSTLHTPDTELDAASARSAEAGLPDISLSAPQGKLLSLLARSIGAKRVLEIGTLGGYSAIWLARALPADGKLITLEADPRHAEVALANLTAAGLAERVEIRLGKAVDSLEQLQGEGVGGFDLVFIDADKPSNPHYLQAALAMTHPGSMIIVDNTVREGAIVDQANTSPAVLGTRAAYELLHDDPRIDATAIQTVGVKGYDGFILGIVN